MTLVSVDAVQLDAQEKHPSVPSQSKQVVAQVYMVVQGKLWISVTGGTVT